ncbi:hypothetical protein BT96DRAFT_923614 [Gymnopus androsaceus JB14]|uniref:Golgi apparatus membrane protein TVP38 n=1 Tax=Gymnopus androsaceus JB14 TaxID=1447944 RepID=A0A6A4HAV5_9AGAR|nr:hypothetical protein BT96DRAFT_923614 [Gymnopus androsaceus JB14]
MARVSIPPSSDNRMRDEDHYTPLADRNPGVNYYPPVAPAPSYGKIPSNDTNPSGNIRRGGGRTPSPTPSEVLALDGKSPPLTTTQRIVQAIIISLIVALVVLSIVFNNKIIKGLTPFTQKLHNLPAGWLVPVGMIFVLSFPPLFGQEFVALLCGVGWGLGEGFGIVAFGTLLGEIGNYFVFKWCCTSVSRKYAKKNIDYACLVRILHDGGFKVALAARYSVIPPHLTTAVFACSGLGFFAFLPAVIFSLPKQFASVLLGYIFEQEALHGKTREDVIGQVAISVISAVITVIAARYTSAVTKKVKPQVIYERRKARQHALEEA